MTEEKLPKISCPLCGKPFWARKSGSRTRKQWKASLMVHLVASLRHNLSPEEAERIADAHLYIKRGKVNP